MKNCPYCKGVISDTAKACGHCGQWLAESPLDTPPPPPKVATPPPPPVEPREPAPPSPLDTPVPPPAQPKMKESTPPKPRRSVPGWVWGVVVLVVVVVVVVALFVTGAIRLPESPATSVPPTSEPPGETVDPVTLMLFEEQERVAAGTPIILKMGWSADTPELVDEYIEANDVSITVDGVRVSNADSYWGEIEQIEDQDGDGDVDYRADWLYSAGVLRPGTHEVVTVHDMQWTLTDGMDMDGDGLPDEYGEGSREWVLQIIVE